MRFIDLAKSRTSVRRYDPERKVDRTTLERCLEAARLAPSASNAQPWHFIVVDEPLLKEKVAQKTYSRLISFNRFAVQAPVLAVVVAEEDRVLPRLGGLLKRTRFSLIDIGIASEHFCLQATEEGFGTCMLGWFNEPAIRKLLDIPVTRRIALVITVGYPADLEVPGNRTRKNLEQMSSFNHYR